MAFRWLLLFVFCFAIAPLTATAQIEGVEYRVSKSQLEYVDAQLKDARARLVKEIAGFKERAAAVENGEGWADSQVLWEQGDQAFGFPSPEVKEALAVDVGQRSQQQLDLIETFYLGMVNDQSRTTLQLLYERVEWLNPHELGGEMGVSGKDLKYASVMRVPTITHGSFVETV